MSVREDASVVTLESVIQNPASYALEDCVLTSVVGLVGVDGVEAVVEGERLWSFPAENGKIF